MCDGPNLSRMRFNASCLQVRIQRELVAHHFDLSAHFGLDGLVTICAVCGDTVDNLDNPIGNLTEFGFTKPTGSTSGRAQTDT